MNNFCKASDAALEAWAGLLHAVDKSRLLLHAYDGSHLDRVRAIFARHGVSAERLRFVPLVSPDDYFRLYEQIDIALDPFPYGGGTTTCDALWMGVPVVTLRGETAVGRSGVSILTNLGMTELIAWDADEYIRIAADWPTSCHDWRCFAPCGSGSRSPLMTLVLHEMAGLRTTLRQRIRESPLMDALRFAETSRRRIAKCGGGGVLRSMRRCQTAAGKKQLQNEECKLQNEYWGACPINGWAARIGRYWTAFFRPNTS